MNFRMIKQTLGYLLLFEAAFLLVPMITAAVYQELEFFAFLITSLISVSCGILLVRFGKPKNKLLFARDGFAIVSASWVLISLFGALPFVFSGAIPNFIDALFETVSGFTTTGASILADVESLPRSIIMWRSFTHWVGGMGVLVFIIAFLPLSGGQNMHIMKAESPGPSVSKLVPRVKNTAIILYVIYIVLTVIQFVFLMLGGNSIFDSVNLAFATAGTGGFGIRNDSMASFSPYTQIVVTVFMLLFSINFNSYYLILKRKFKDALNTEVRVFLYVVTSAIVIISFNILGSTGAENIGDAFRHSAFTVASLISTSGFSTLDFNAWPELSKTLLVFVMFIGACAGSTGGGIKVSRIILMFKGMTRELSKLTHPKEIKKITLDSRPVEHEVIRSINAYIVCYIALFAISVLLLSFNGYDATTNFTAVTATINNIGPGLSAVGPASNYAFFSPFSKLVLIFDMIAGRLELFPMLVLFAPSTWRK
ncbi:MAG: TrkH family potassium uptake protein [Clostridia bacterium]|nr:TrkH family potassium uptake protein [Clostridia bacterium]